MTNRDKDIILHIIRYCDNVAEDIREFGDTFEDFEAKRSFRDSVSMNILQIGELSHNLSEEFRESTKQNVPWKDIYNMRNHFAHGYELMDNKIIWEVAAVEVPALKKFCEEQINASDQEKS